jgi:hypothetical protein
MARVGGFLIALHDLLLMLMLLFSWQGKIWGVLMMRG